MALEQQVMEALKEAMKAKDEAGLRALRAIKSAIILAKTAEGGNGEVSEAEELKMLQKLVKQRKDAAQIFHDQQRADLAKKEEEEITIIERFLPKQMDESEVKAAVQAIIAQLGASTPADMGKVMGVATKELAGKAEGKTISALVKALLSGA